MVIADIELIDCLRPLHLVKDCQLCYSDFYLQNNYLTAVQRQCLYDLSNQNNILIFESGNEFYNFYNINKKETVGIAGMSSIFYALSQNRALITECPILKSISENYNIAVYDYLRALNELNVPIEYVDFIIKNMLSMQQ